MEICAENLTGKKIEKLTPKMVRRLLGIDNKEIAELCRQISLVPKKDAKGQTYFSKEDVDVLQKIQQLHSKSVVNSNVIEYKPQVSIQKIPESLDTVSELPALSQSFDELGKMLVGKIAKVIDEKLEGMDEVVVELIRCKSENEALRQKINNLNKELYQIKNDISSFKHLGFNLYVKKQPFEV